MEPTVIRSSSPFEVLALAERTLGFRPRESLVVVSLRPPRWRSGLVARADLADAPEALDALAAHLRADGARRGFVAVVTDAGALPPPGPGALAGLPHQRDPHQRDQGPDVAPASRGEVRRVHLPGAPVAQEAARALRAQGVAPELWLAHRGRLVSYDCTQRCCPPAGLPLRDVDATRVAAEMVLAGRGLARDREEWEASHLASVAPADPAQVTAVEEQLERVDRRWRRWDRDRRSGRQDPAGPAGEPPAVALALWWGLLEAAQEDPAAVDGLVGAAGPEVAAVLLDALGRPPVRDLLLGVVVPEAMPPCPWGCVPGAGVGRSGGDCPLCSWGGGGHDGGGGEALPRADAAVLVLQELARLAPPGRRAAALGCTAYALWSRGASAPAGLLAELALRADPGHSLSDLVLQSVRLGVAPPSVRVARRAG